MNAANPVSISRHPFVLVVMAKAPEAGLAKTRLIPALGAEGAAALAHRLLQHAMEQATTCKAHSVHLCVWPDERHPAFSPWADHARVQLHRQSGIDLGARMDTAMAGAFQEEGVQGVLIMGTDAPALDADALDAAMMTLAQTDAVVVPAADGGYALIGLRRHHASVFQGVAWSTPQVLAQTRQALERAGLCWREQAMVHDIDEPQDLQHLPAGWERGPRA